MFFPLDILNKHFQSPNQFRGIFSIYGDYGVGKTIFSLQTALYNSSLGNLVIYIYTKPNFPYSKINNLIQNFEEKVLDNLLVYLILDFNKLSDLILDLEQIIIKIIKDKTTSKILIVIDSLTNLYQLEIRKNSKSKNFILNYQLNLMLATLSLLNIQYKVNVLIVNYLRRLKNENQTLEIQSGGKVMDYWLDYSLKIERHKKLNHRKILLTKDPEKKKLNLLSKLTKFGFE